MTRCGTQERRNGLLTLVIPSLYALIARRSGLDYFSTYTIKGVTVWPVWTVGLAVVFVAVWVVVVARYFSTRPGE